MCVCVCAHAQLRGKSELSIQMRDSSREALFKAMALERLPRGKGGVEKMRAKPILTSISQAVQPRGLQRGLGKRQAGRWEEQPREEMVRARLAESKCF